MLGLISCKIKALYLIEESRKAREDREEKEISRSRGILSPNYLSLCQLCSQVSRQVMLRSNCALKYKVLIYLEQSSLK